MTKVPLRGIITNLFNLWENFSRCPYLDKARQCHNAAFEALKAGEDQKELARRLIEIIARGSALAKSDLSDWPYLIPIAGEGYQQYFKKNNMI